MKVVLVNPPYVFWKAGAEHIRSLLGHYAPLGLLSLAAYGREHVTRLELSIVDAPAQGLSREETERRVIDEAPDVVGITMTTTVAQSAEAIAQTVKAALPHVTVVVGGPHVSGTGAPAMQKAASFDVAVLGEGELTFTDVLQALREGRALSTVPGILYRDQDCTVNRTPPRPPIADLDTLPMPAFDLLPDFPEAYQPNIFFSPAGPAAGIVTSRGCPFRCRFCDQSTFGHRYRAASPESVFATVRKLREDYGIRYVLFLDDTFTIDRRRVLALCELMRGVRPRLAWSCDANVMTVDREMLRAMKRAGCWSISFGLESGSPRVLRSSRKEIDLDRAREVISATRAAGIHAKGLFMLGVPEESRETILETRAFVRSLALSTMNLSKFTPYPGTEMYAEVADGLAVRPMQLNGMNFVVPSRHLSIEELEHEYAILLKHFYGRPACIMRHLAFLLGRWRNIRRLSAVAMDVVKAKFLSNADGSPALGL